MRRPSPLSCRWPICLAFTLALAGSSVVVGQDDGRRTLSPVDSSGSYEVGGIAVDVTAGTADAARLDGWRLAQRKGWQMLSQRLGAGGALVADSTLDAVVSGIVIEDEQIGPTRYIARLGVLFNRSRAGALLGIAGDTLRSPPMLLLPIVWSGGVGEGFERHSDWLDAWLRYRTGNSIIDYVRPSGTGADALLLNTGQATRPGRIWWRHILDQYGASDILAPTARLYREWPGGPIVAVFDARHGPDDRSIGHFTLRVGNGDALNVLLDAGVRRIDELYQAALRSGLLRTDPSLSYTPPVALPAANTGEPVEPDQAQRTDMAGAIAYSVQVETRSASAVTGIETSLATVPGVRSATVSSLALGGVSVMRVMFAGDPASLTALLEQRGWTVQPVGGSQTTLRLRRDLLPTLPQAPALGDAVTG